MSRVLPNIGPGPIDHTRHWAKSHELSFGAAVPSFPESLNKLRLGVSDQGTSEFCTAYGEATSNGYEKGQIFSPEWQTAAEGEYLGAPINSGADPYPSMQATSIMGSLPIALSPFTLQEKGEDFIADWNNWPATLNALASAYKSNLIPYYIDGNYDTFGNIQNALYQAFLANEKGVVKAFGFWYESWNEQAEDPSKRGFIQCPPTNEQPISRHRYTFIDWITVNGTPYLVAALTQGSSFGDNGFLYFDRATINQVFANALVNGLGLYINRLPKDNWDAAVQWFKAIITFLATRVNLLIKH